MTGTAVVLPGRRHGHEQPGLRLAELVLEQYGVDLVRVDWPDEGMPTDVASAADAVAEIVASYLDDGPAYVVAKSLGTLAAPLVADRGIAAIWLTPLLDEPLCREAILRNPARQLLVGGTDDFAWRPAVARAAARAGAAVTELDGADHGFEVAGDAAATVEMLIALTRAVSQFVDADPR